MSNKILSMPSMGSRFLTFMAVNSFFTSGVICFLVIMFFVSVNALFYQPYAHKDAFFKTRPMSDYKAPAPLNQSLNQEGEATNFKISRAEDGAVDINLKKVQHALTSVNLYNGTIDGVEGPKTRQAIMVFQKRAGLTPTGTVDRSLIDALKTYSITPKTSVSSLAIEDVKKIQQGLKAFGNEDIESDGKVGARTKEALLEFQNLFQLEATGSADQQTLHKLQELGLI